MNDIDKIQVQQNQQGYARESAKESWCPLHQRALDALTREWQLYVDLKLQTDLDYNVFEDLWAFGIADRGTVPLCSDAGQARGWKIYLRLKQGDDRVTDELQIPFHLDTIVPPPLSLFND